MQSEGFRVQVSGLRVQGAGCRVQASEFRVQGPGFGDQWPLPRLSHARVLAWTINPAFMEDSTPSGQFRIQGSGCRVQGSGCRVQGTGFRGEWPLPRSRDARVLAFPPLKHCSALRLLAFFCKATEQVSRSRGHSDALNGFNFFVKRQFSPR